MKRHQYYVRFITPSGDEKQIECWAESEEGARFMARGRHDFETFISAVKKYV